MKQTFRDPTAPARSESIHDGRLSRRFFIDSWQKEAVDRYGADGFRFSIAHDVNLHKLRLD